MCIVDKAYICKTDYCRIHQVLNNYYVLNFSNYRTKNLINLYLTTLEYTKNQDLYSLMIVMSP